MSEQAMPGSARGFYVREGLNVTWVEAGSVQCTQPPAHSALDARPKGLTIEALPHGGYLVKRMDEPFRDMSGLPLAGFTVLSDAVTWMENQMALTKAEPETSGKRS